MKKVIFSVILALSIVNSVYADSASPQLKYAIRQYKVKNYLGALQSLEKLTTRDPGNALAHYYLGMCYVQVGDSTKASTEYDKVIAIDPNSQLAKNANLGKDILSGKTPSAPTDKAIIPVTHQTKDFLSEEAKFKIQEKNIKTIIENANNRRENDPALFNRVEKLDKKSSNDKPTEEQIAEAMQVLTKAGINPAASYTPYPQTAQVNPELMQMNMMMSAFGGNNNNTNGNSMNNMMPLLMMMQNGQGNTKVDPETIQTMMSTMMMPGMMNLYDSNNNNN